MITMSITIDRALTAILDLEGQLLTQAVHAANSEADGHSLPGGNAMVALAPVADMERHNQRIAAAEHDWMQAHAHEGHTGEFEGWMVHDSTDRPEWGADEDDAWEPPLQTIRFWSDHYRRVRQQDWDSVRTLVTEAKFLKFHLAWILEHEPNATQFARDIAAARRRLENLLKAGERSERGVPCMYDECGGVRLARKIIPARGPNGEKTWKLTDWHCPRCKRSWDEETYWRNVLAANERAQTEEIDGEMWCSIDYAARTVARSVKTIRTWIDRGELPTVCVISGRRSRYVPLATVRARHHEASRRQQRRLGA